MHEVNSLDLKKNRKQLKYPLISGGITLLCFIIMLILSDVYPFGSQTVVVSDLEAQYAPFLFMNRYHLGNIDWSHFPGCLTYTFLLGAGKNIMSTFGYYLSSPLNILIVFFKPHMVNEFICLLMALKITLASVFMCRFLMERSKTGSMWPVLFGVVYSFSSYAMAFLFNIMWLDGYALLPLLLLFTEKFVKEGKKGGLIVTLILLFASNYYIAYMAGIFTFIYLLERMSMTEGLGVLNRKGARKIGKFILIAVLCALTVCVILIPTGLDTIRNGDPVAAEKTSRLMYSSVLGLADRMFLGTTGDFAEIMIANPPFIFLSLLVTLSLIIYFISPVFRGRERKIRAFLTAGVFLSVSVIAIDTVWHVFDMPNWFWHRQSFVFMPFFLIIACEVMEKMSDIEKKDILRSSALLLIVLFIDESFGKMNKYDNLFVFNLAFILAITGVLFLMKKEKWHDQLRDMPRILPALLAVLVVFETAFMGNILSSGIATLSVHYGDAAVYTDSIRAALDCQEGYELAGKGFRYESEQIDLGTRSVAGGNASIYAGSRGITLFNSNSNKKFHRFLKQLGYAVNYNYFAAGYSFSAADTDAFFSIGALTTRHDYEDAKFIATDDYNAGLKFYLNDNVLDAAFPVDRGAFDFDMYSLEKSTGGKNYLSFRNEWFRSMFPREFTEDIYIIDGKTPEPEIFNGDLFDGSIYETTDTVAEFPAEEISKYDEDKKANSNPDRNGLENEKAFKDKTVIGRYDPEKPVYVKFRYNVVSEGELYMNISAPRILSESTVYLNGKRLTSWGADTYYSQVIRLGSFHMGDTVEIVFKSDSDTFVYDSLNFAYLDKYSFDMMMDRLDTSSVSVEEITDGYVKIRSDLDGRDMILTSIPYEDGWTLTIDGKKADIKVYQDALIGIDPGTGVHEIELTFCAPGLYAGAICSILGAVGLILFCIFDKKNNKGKTSSQTK